MGVGARALVVFFWLGVRAGASALQRRIHSGMKWEPLDWRCWRRKNGMSGGVVVLHEPLTGLGGYYMCRHGILISKTFAIYDDVCYS